MNTNLTTLGTNDLRFSEGIIFTSGALNGVFAQVASHTGGGALLTLTSALSSAPAAGDTFKAMRLTVRTTGDGTHPVYSSTTAPGFGGQPLMADVVHPAIQAA